ncbi:MAG: hypothetical protein IPI48_15765 [bacterium]|nr:hypothetical protein [bacterium]
MLWSLAAAGGAQAVTLVNMDITTDTVWSDADYCVTESITVEPGVVLTVPAGTVVSFGLGVSLTIEGQLQVQGTALERVIFTAVADDQRNGDVDNGGPSVGRIGDWGGVLFAPGSDGSGLSWCDIWFGGASLGAMIACDGSSPDLNDCRLRAGSAGVRCLNGAAPSLVRTSIDGCAGVPVVTDLASDPVFDGVIFSAEQDNRYDAVGLLGGITTGNASIAARQVTIGDGPAGDISYLVLGSVTIDATHTLDIAPGQTLKFMPGTMLEILGRLTTAAAGNRTIFTSLHDDQHGYPRDSGRDGNTKAPGAGDWGGLRVLGTGDAIVQDADVLYAATAVTVGEMATAAVQRARLAYGITGLTAMSTGIVTLDDCDLVGHLGTPIRQSLDANVSWSGVRPLANGINAIELLPGTLAVDRTLAARSLGTWENVTWYLDGLVTVADGATLTIAPGVTLKMGSTDAGIAVAGTLLAVAPVDNPIVFTSIDDDCAGLPADTRSDFWNRAPCPGDWNSLSFRRGSTGSLLDGCIIRFGGAGRIGAVEATGVDVPIANSLFEYNLTALGSQGLNLELVRDKRDLGLSNVAFLNNVADMVVPIGGTLARDAVLTGFPGLDPIFVLDRDLVIPFGIHLEIQPGVDITAIDAGIDVHGSLSWSGSVDRVSTIGGPSGWTPNPIVPGDPGPGIPSLGDCVPMPGCNYDELSPFDTGNDKRADVGDGVWTGIRVFATSDDSRTLFRDLHVTGAAEPFRCEDSSPLCERVIFDGMGEDGIGILGRSAPEFVECIFRRSAGVPARLSLSATPRFTDSLFRDNAWSGLGLAPQGTADLMHLSAATLTEAGLGSYVALGDLSVAAGQSLTIDAGVVLKFAAETSLLVDGLLAVEGVNDFGQLVILTSMTDDSFGGDTNGDGAFTRGNDATWSGIICSAFAAATPPVLTGCVIANAAGVGDAGALHIEGGVSPDLTEVLFIGNERHLVIAAGGGDPALGTVTRCDFAGGADIVAVHNAYPLHTVAAADCWWGDASGPFDDAAEPGGLYNPAGTGCEVSSGVDYAPFTTTGSHVRLRGDVSRDGRVTVHDASVLVRHLAGTWPLDDEALLRADADCDGSIDALDAAVVLEFVVGNRATLDCAMDEEPASEGAQLVYHGFNATTRELSLSWSGSRPPRAASLRVRSLQDRIRVTGVRLSTPDGSAPVAATGSADGTMTYVFANEGELPGGSLLIVTLAPDGAVDTSGDLVAIDRLHVDGAAAPDLDVRIDHGASPPEVPARPLSASPNPCNPTTTIEFVVTGEGDRPAPVALGVYDLTGRRVKTLALESLAPGVYRRQWNGMDDNGKRAASGIYVLRLTQGDVVANHKLTLLK